MIVLPDRLRLENNYWGQLNTYIVAPQVGIAFAKGRTDYQLKPGERDSLSNIFRFDTTFLLQQASNSAYEFSVLEGEKIGEAETRILEVKGYGVRDWLYVDSQTGRVLRGVRFLPDGSRSTWSSSDWATVDGMIFALTAKGSDLNQSGETTWEWHVTAIELNPPVDDRLFERNGPSLADIPFHPAALLPAPEPPRTANLNIRTQPGNAQAYLNDEFRGTSSSEGNLAVSNLKPGNYRLRLTLIGYKEWTQSLDLVADDNQNIEARLEPAGPKPLELGEIEEALKNGIDRKSVV